MAAVVQINTRYIRECRPMYVLRSMYVCMCVHTSSVKSVHHWYHFFFFHIRKGAGVSGEAGGNRTQEARRDTASRGVRGRVYVRGLSLQTRRLYCVWVFTSVASNTPRYDSAQQRLTPCRGIIPSLFEHHFAAVVIVVVFVAVPFHRVALWSSSSSSLP